MKTSVRIREALAAIEAILANHEMPGSDPAAIRAIRFQASYLPAIDVGAAESAARIVDLAEIYYSERKHSKYRGGIDALRYEMTVELPNAIRDRAAFRERHGD